MKNEEVLSPEYVSKQKKLWMFSICVFSLATIISMFVASSIHNDEIYIVSVNFVMLCFILCFIVILRWISFLEIAKLYETLKEISEKLKKSDH